MVFVNTRFLYPIQPVSDTLVPHAMPANRRILLQSWHTEAALLCTHAPSQGVIMVA
jgi:hypothetical protein